MNQTGLPEIYDKEYCDEDEIDILELIKILWDKKWIIIASGLIFSAIAIGYALLSDRYYLAETTLIVGDEGGNKGSSLGRLGGFAAIAGVDLSDSNPDKNYYIAVLKSRIFLKEFIEENKLMSIFYQDIWDDEKQTWILKKDEDPPSIYKACKFFNESIMTVSENKDNSLISLKVSWKDPELASIWANQLVLFVNNYIRERKINEYDTKVKYLEKQIEQTSVVNMQKIFYKLIEQQIQNQSMAQVKKDFAFQVVDPAVTPELPHKPNRKLIVLLGGFSGGFFGIFLVFALNFVSQAKERFKEES
ncbi:MAG: Wzz/FepE/Etk N-terminal domain-containing protein [Desulforegulaceae bacterium]|nr:Wzz/FepE/Etk N-terminal domain-containing protein [Desulforegulaceae bacterium]